jgi:hypothetical protein
MASWPDLPNEIRELILRFFMLFFLQDLPEVYNGFDKLEYIGDTNTLKWPNAPQSLTSFASVVRTCKSFHTIIMDMKLNGKLVVERLHLMQWDRIVASEDYFRHRLFGLEVVAELEEIFAVAGCFWRNRKFMSVEKIGFFWGFFAAWLSRRSQLMLVPHCEEWLRCRKVDYSPWSNRTLTLSLTAKNNCLCPFCIHDDDHEDGGADGDVNGRIILKAGKFAITGEDFLFGTIAGVVNKEPIKGVEQVRAIEDIRNSKPDEWWFLPTPGFGENMRLRYGETAGSRWYLVNYDQRKFYQGPDGNTCYCWDDVWTITKS